MNEKSDGKWEGVIETKVAGIAARILRLERFLGGVIAAMAALYLRSKGLLP